MRRDIAKMKNYFFLKFTPKQHSSEFKNVDSPECASI